MGATQHFRIGSIPLTEGYAKSTMLFLIFGPIVVKRLKNCAGEHLAQSGADQAAFLVGVFELLRRRGYTGIGDPNISAFVVGIRCGIPTIFVVIYRRIARLYNALMKALSAL
jgi:hypothetical protein